MNLLEFIHDLAITNRKLLPDRQFRNIVRAAFKEAEKKENEMLSQKAKEERNTE